MLLKKYNRMMIDEVNGFYNQLVFDLLYGKKRLIYLNAGLLFSIEYPELPKIFRKIPLFSLPR